MKRSNPGIAYAVKVFLLALFLVSCFRASVHRAEWQRMSPGERHLYVRSLIGHEKAQERKGGTALRSEGDPDESVRAIDEAYRRGDTRDPDAIFAARTRVKQTP